MYLHAVFLSPSSRPSLLLPHSLPPPSILPPSSSVPPPFIPPPSLDPSSPPPLPSSLPPLRSLLTQSQYSDIRLHPIQKQSVIYVAGGGLDPLPVHITCTKYGSYMTLIMCKCVGTSSHNTAYSPAYSLCVCVCSGTFQYQSTTARLCLCGSRLLGQ